MRNPSQLRNYGTVPKYLTWFRNGIYSFPRKYYLLAISRSNLKHNRSKNLKNPSKHELKKVLANSMYLFSENTTISFV